MKGLGYISFFLFCFAAAPGGAESGPQSAVFNGIEAETPLLTQQLKDPGRFFLWHGGFSVDGFMPASPPLGSWDLWGPIAPHHSWQVPGEIGHHSWQTPDGTRDRANAQATGNPRFEANVRLGNEVGDQHLQELRALEHQSNYTPLTQGQARLNFTSSASLWAAMDQNDHFSSTTLPLRGGIGNEEPAWFGENLPYYSFLQGGMESQWDNDWGILHINQAYQDGWLWTTSPWTGTRLPWRGRHYRGSAKLGNSWEGGGSFIHRKSLLNGFEEEKAWEERSGYLAWNKGLQWKDHHWHLKLQGGLSQVTLDLDSLLYNGEGFTYPLDGELHWQWGEAERTRLNLDFRQHFKNGSHWSEGQIAGTIPRGAVAITAELAGYAGQNEVVLPLEREFLPDVSQPITYPSGKKQFGFSPKLRGLWKRGGWSTDLSARVSGRSGLLTFATDSLILRNGFSHRAGEVLPLEEMIWQADGSWRESLRWNQSLGGVQLAWQKPLTRNHKRLDYEPSAYVFSLFGKTELPSDLTIETVVHYVGPKKVRHWLAGDRVFTVPEHWEGNLNLTQSLWRDWLRLNYTALHLFGREVLEHPLGNPLRFRIIVTAQAAF